MPCTRPCPRCECARPSCACHRFALDHPRLSLRHRQPAPNEDAERSNTMPWQPAGFDRATPDVMRSPELGSAAENPPRLRALHVPAHPRPASKSTHRASSNAASAGYTPNWCSSAQAFRSCARVRPPVLCSVDSPHLSAGRWLTRPVAREQRQPEWLHQVLPLIAADHQ
ncbi:hypothetical protein K458DRAFT_212510 [Lentithecium fluviatile CBS 122367]|uniref:Uncharacterized protein n=1 Tax=Lentithecium fluviatile CBS 122367 TaxID=1168545 RepID=A0A6G1IC56_9PLEO|nr:hypothetical protein K458DRAFT_212510 [Lentithecium fluviatile CBS 122367]